MCFTGVLQEHFTFQNLQLSTCSSHYSMWHHPKAQVHAKRRNSQIMAIQVSSLTSQERKYMQLQSTAATRVALFKVAVLLHLYTSICDAATANGMIIPVQQEGKYLMPYSSCLLSCLFIEDGNTWELLVAIMIVRCIQCYPFTFSELYCPLSCCTLSTLTVEM